jgi:hypothetical protein
VKDHKLKSVSLYSPELGGRIENVEQILLGFIEEVKDERATLNMKNATIVEHSDPYDPCGPYSLCLEGWVPLNEKELALAKANRKKDRDKMAAKKKSTEAAERKEYKRLKAKFGKEE